MHMLDEEDIRQFDEMNGNKVMTLGAWLTARSLRESIRTRGTSTANSCGISKVESFSPSALPVLSESVDVTSQDARSEVSVIR